MPPRRFPLLPILASAACLFTAACSIIPQPTPDPTRYFVLQDPATTTAVDPVTSAGATIGLLPIALPAYLLDSRAIAVAGVGSEVSFRDFDRWAEPLDEGLARVLRSALTRADGVQRVLVPPFPLTPARDYDLHTRIIDCIGVAAGDNRTLRFGLSFELTAPDGTLKAQGTFRAAPAAWSGESSELANLISEATAAAATAIAAEL